MDGVLALDGLAIPLRSALIGFGLGAAIWTAYSRYDKFLAALISHLSTKVNRHGMDYQNKARALGY